MHHGGSVPPARVRRHHLLKDKRIDLLEPSPASPDLGSVSSLRRQVAASLMQHHRTIQRNHHPIQPQSATSYGSSMEVAPYNRAVTPTSSIDFKGGIGDMSYSLKTSTELLKVLNRIWSLEEQHSSNVSLVKTLKKELQEARARIKELTREKQADRHEMNELMNQIAEEKLSKKSKEEERINSAVQSLRNELEDERKLRKRSETLHRKLAKELQEVKFSLSSSATELENERKSRKLVEDLCDEFAWGIKNYEQEIHSLKPKSDKDFMIRADRDGLILHISESWLDGRLQTKQEPKSDLKEKNHSAVEKMRSEIETFLQVKRHNNFGNRDALLRHGPAFRRASLESMPLNMASSAPQGEGDNEEVSSTGSDSHCFELDKPDLKPRENKEEEDVANAIPIQSNAKKNVSPQGSSKVKLEEQVARAMTNNERKIRSEETVSSLIRKHYLLSESQNEEKGSGSSAARRDSVSLAKQWTTKLPEINQEALEPSSKPAVDSKEKTLKSKLIEARVRGQRSRSRLKGTKVSF